MENKAYHKSLAIVKMYKQNYQVIQDIFRREIYVEINLKMYSLEKGPHSTFKFTTQSKRIPVRLYEANISVQ